MKSKTATNVVNMIATCKVCGETNIDNECRLLICGETFERYCDKCGWRITGKVDNDEIVIVSDNSNVLK